MLAAEFNDWNTLPFLATHPVWRMAFEWIKTKSGQASEGQHQDFPDTRMFARVMEYSLKPREEARYENHRFTVEGARGRHQAAEDFLVSDVDTVEVAEGQHRRRKAPANPLQMAEK